MSRVISPLHRSTPRFLRVVLAFVLAVPLALAGLVISPASADQGVGTMTLDKSIDGTGPFGAGDTFSFLVRISCSNVTGAGCVDALMEDPVPAIFELDTSNGPAVTVSHSDLPASQYTITTTGNDVKVAFKQPLDSPDVGLEAGMTDVTVRINVRVPADTLPSESGAVTNRARVTQSNGQPVTDSAVANVVVPLELDTAVAKSTTQTATLPAVPGQQVPFSIGARNTSNSPVDSLIVQDPSEDSTGDPFEYLELTGLTITPPQGADRVAFQWKDADGTWHPDPADAGVPIPSDPNTLLPADTSQVHGIRMTFTKDGGQLPIMAAGEGGTIGLTTVTRDNVADIPSGSTVTVTNRASSQVTSGDETSTVKTAQAQVRIQRIPPTVDVTKDFTRNTINSGESTVATITAENGSVPIKSMTVTEPSSGDDLVEQGLQFGGFTGDLEWPQGATAASIQYLYSDCAAEAPKQTTTVDSLPAPTSGCRVSGFTVTFTGSMPAHAYATLPFTVTADRVPSSEAITSTNHTSAEVVDVLGQASDVATDEADLTRRPLVLDVESSKNIARDWVWATPGARTLVSLRSGVAESSTVQTDRLVITDPADPSSTPSDFWDNFDLTRIAPTDIPTGTTLTVDYWDGSSWQTLVADVAAQGGWTYTVPANLRDTIQGIRFTFESASAGAKLASGFSVLPYFEVALRSTLRSDPTTSTEPDVATSVTNDVEVAGHNADAIDPDPTDSASDQVELRPVDGGPGVDMIDKRWLNDEVIALTDDQRTARISWSTQGLPADSITITDPNSSPSAVASSVYDAFDLARIEPINDPLMKFDRVSKVELYLDGAWTDITSQMCAGTACYGAFPGYTLTSAERLGALGVRLTIVENPNRAPTSPTDPAVGSGVATSYDNGRPIDLTFQLRQDRRSDGAPVLGTELGPTYNGSGVGVVDNTVGLASVQGTTTRTSADDAEITILDRPVNVAATKSFDQSTIGLPPPGTAAEEYPLVTGTLTTTNNGEGKVRELSITDPSPDSTDEFLTDFRVYAIDTVTAPTGTVTTCIIVRRLTADDACRTVLEAAALTPAQLADATGVVFRFTGFMPKNAVGTAAVTYQLRETTTAPPGTSSTNVVKGQVVSPAGTASAITNDSVTLVTPTYGIQTAKSISPATRTETASRVYTVNTNAYTTGTVRTKSLELTDDKATFWNAFDFTQFSAMTMPKPVNQARVSVLAGVDYAVDANNHLVVTCGGSTDLDPCWVVPSTWRTVTSGTSWTPTLPVGVTAADVRGLRIEYRRSDGTNWERPYNPTMQLNFTATMRTNLRAGTNGVDTTVPTTRPDFDPAPDETARGTTTDTVESLATGAWNNQDEVWTASGTATATTVRTHLKQAIQVTKNPGNATTPPQYSPGATIPYALTFRNTGERTMSDLTFEDEIETDAGGSLLVLPSDEFGNPSAAWVFQLYNAAGTQIDSSGFSAQFDATTGHLSILPPAGFTFPVGYRLAVGTPLVFRSDLPAGSTVSNAVTVTSDRVFDTCQYTLNGVGQTAQTNVTSCTASTTVRSQAAAGLRVIKGVKGDGGGLPDAAEGESHYDDLGVYTLGSGATSACASPNDANGFYRYPCVPIVRPAGDERWQLTITNQGNVPAGVLAGIDTLPRPGDTGVILSDSRGSDYAVKLLGDFRTIFPDTQDKTVEFFYSNTVPATACNAADINNETTVGGIPTTNPCYSDVNSRAWVAVTGSTTAADLVDAKAIKYVVTYDAAASGGGLAPGRTAYLNFKTQSAPYVDTARTSATNDKFAWNSTAAGARGVLNSSTYVAQPVEPRRVGVLQPTGRFDLLKTVGPDDWQYPLPADYQFKLTCTSDGVTVPLKGGTGNTAKDVVTLTADTLLHYNDARYTGPYQFVNLPAWATCSVAEQGNQHGATVEYDPQQVTAQYDQSDSTRIVNPALPSAVASERLTVENTFHTGGFTVTKKVVDGGPLDQDGDPVTYTRDFDFNATCTYLDETVLDEDFTLADGGSKDFQDLPTSADCTVTETDTAGAADTALVATQGDDTISGDASVDFSIVTGDETATTIEATNTYTTGAVRITKSITGAGADAWGTEPVSVKMVCTLAGTSPSPVFSDTKVLNEAPGTDANVLTWTVRDLPTGASCAVTEPTTGGANDSTITPGTVTVGSGSDPVQVAVANVFDTGEVSVTKALSGPGAGAGPVTGGTYVVSLACTREVDGDDQDVTVPGGAQRTITGAGTVTYSGLPTGATCVVSEVSSDPQTDGVILSPADGTVVVPASTADPVAVTVTNSFDEGALTVRKTLSGPGADAAVVTDGAYGVSLACTRTVDGEQVDVAVPGGADRTITGAGTVTYTGLPTGASCVVSEDSSDPEADATTLTPAGGAVTIPKGEAAPVTVTVDNFFDEGSVTVHKTLSGPGAGAGPVTDGSYTVSLACTRVVGGDDVAVAIPGGAQRTITGADTVTYSGLPTGATCVVAEDSSDPQADDSSLSPTDGTVVVPAGTADPVEVTVDNFFDQGSLTVRKTLSGPGAEADPVVNGSYVMTLDCTRVVGGDDVTVPVPGGADRTITGAGSATYTGLPTGATCVVSEKSSDPQSDDSSLSPADGTVTIPAGSADPVEVSVDNFFDQGSVTVTKTLSGPGAEFDPVRNGTYTMSIACTREVGDGTVDVAIPGGAEREITGAGEATWDGLPTGANCVVSESASVPEPQDVQITPEGGQVTVPAGEAAAAQVTVDNRFGVGFMKILKTIDGPGGGVFSTKPLGFDVDCTLPNGTISNTEVTLTPEAGQTSLESDVLGPFPGGTTCHVVETDRANADATTGEATVVIVEGTREEPVVATIANTYGAGRVEVTKEVAGRYADRIEVARTKFAMTLTCELETTDAQGATVRGTVLSADFRLRAGKTKQFAQLLPTGTHCFVSETDDGGATEVSIAHDSYDNGAVVSSTTEAAELSIVVKNVFDEDVWSQEEERCPDCDNGLSSTGSDVSPGWIALGGLSIVAGGAALVAARRRRRDAA